MQLPENFVIEFDGLREGLQLPPEVSIRYNLAKGAEVPLAADRVPWCNAGCYLPERPKFTMNPAMHQGLYYVQDASSMIYSHIVGLLTANEQPVSLLDACAAPGGKTTAAIDSLPEGSTVVANEYVATRAAVLRENIIKWGYGNVVVSRGDTSRISKLRNEFDIVIADVPCSGEGMFRKEPEAVAQWSPALVAECARLQREIIDNLWHSLKPGGYMIYSTCTFNRSENQDNLNYMKEEYGAESVVIPVNPDWGIVERDGCLHFLPGRVRGEGLTVTVVRKPGVFTTKSQRSERAKTPPAQAKACMEWVDAPEKYSWQLVDERIIAMANPSWVARVGRALDLIYTGVEVATIKGRDVIPTQALAMWRNVSENAFPRYEVDYEQAINYLRRDTVTLDDAPRGHVLLTYNAHPLGFVKNLGNRANNLYPAPWRILSSLK